MVLSFQRSGFEVYLLEATYKDPAVSSISWRSFFFLPITRVHVDEKYLDDFITWNMLCRVGSQLYFELDTVSSIWSYIYELQGCAARNVHGFSQDDIQKMAFQWEEASSLYLKLDAKVRLFFFVYSCSAASLCIRVLEAKVKVILVFDFDNIFLHEYM